MTSAIVLAAGASTRLGEPKQLVTIAGERLLERAVRTAREAGCSPIVVVLGANHVEVLDRCDLGDAVLVVNSAWTEGMASSIRLGIETVSGLTEDSAGVVLTTCDQPAVTAAHLGALMASGEMTASDYAGKRGVPAYFPKAAFSALTKLRGDTGARDLLCDAAAIELPLGEIDVDTATDLDVAKRVFARGR